MITVVIRYGKGEEFRAGRIQSEVWALADRLGYDVEAVTKPEEKTAS